MLYKVSEARCHKIPRVCSKGDARGDGRVDPHSERPAGPTAGLFGHRQQDRADAEVEFRSAVVPDQDRSNLHARTLPT
jgi:hypothetical protein